MSTKFKAPSHPDRQAETDCARKLADAEKHVKYLHDAAEHLQESLTRMQAERDQAIAERDLWIRNFDNLRNSLV